MWNLKSDSLTPKNGDKFSLTVRDLPKTPNGSVLHKLKKLGVIVWYPKALPWGRILLLQFHSLTSSTIEIISLTI